MCFGIGSKSDDFVFEGIKLPNSCKEKILGVITDNKLKFGLHIRNMGKKQRKN